MVTFLLLTLLQAPTTPAPAKPVLPTTTQPPPQAPSPTPPAARPRPVAPATTTLYVFVTDRGGAALGDVTVTLSGPVDREGKTGSDGALRLVGLRTGTYRLRFDRTGFTSFEKEVTWRSGVPAPEVAVSLNGAPAPPPPPAPPPTPDPAPPSPAPKLPPAGEMKAMALTDYIERNFISSKEPHKENVVGCSGVGQALLWQVREPWEGRQHPSADAMLYVIGGEGSLKLAATEVGLAAGSFAVVPRGTSYGFTRKGRNPLIVLAVLTGAPCAAD